MNPQVVYCTYNSRDNNNIMCWCTIYNNSCAYAHSTY